MKIFTNLFKNPKVLLGVSIVVSILLLVAGSLFLIYPKYQEWQSLKAQNSKDSQTLNIIKENISLLSSQNKSKISEYGKLTGKLLPSEEDPLRVLAIFEGLIQNSGMALEGFEVKTSSQSKKTITVKAPPQPSSSDTLGASTSTTKTATAKKSLKTVGGSFEITATVYGGLSSVLNLIESLDYVKRSIEVSSITIDKAASTEIPKVVITFVMPLGQKGGVTSPETKIEFLASDEKVLDALLENLVIDAEPANSPVGKLEPFGP